MKIYEDDAIEYPDIQPLDTLAEYEALSVEERALRQASVTDYFVTFAISQSRRVRKSTDFLLKEVDEYKEVGNYSSSQEGRKQKEIRLARKLVEADDLCGTVLDRLIAFCITTGTIENVKNKNLLKILNRWAESLGNLESASDSKTNLLVLEPQGLPVTLEQILERLLVDGDSVITESWAEDVVLDGKTYKLPYKISVHDTLYVEIDDNVFADTGREKISLNFTTEHSSLSNDDSIPLYVSEGAPFTAHLKLRPKTFSKWGTSFFKRAFYPVANKKRIEALEVNTIEGLINRLTILKAGKIDSETETGIVAPHRLAILERLISQPKVNNLLLWPGDDISVEDIGPSSSLLTYENKYVETNQQILASLGFPRVLIDGGESSTENWQKFLSLVAFIDKLRNVYIIPWVNQLLRKIAVQNGYNREFPRYTFARVKLYDLRELLNAVKVFYDRGLISELSALSNGDFDYDIEFSRRTYEKEFGIISNLGGVNGLPFSKNTPDGNNKEGITSPEKEVEKKDKVVAAINDADREEIVETFSDYLYNLHDIYTEELVSKVSDKDYEKVDAVFLAYYTAMKKDIREQMTDLFNTELQGASIDESLLKASMEWMEDFVDGYFEDMEAEVAAVIKNNKDKRASLLPDLIAGIMGAFKTKRLRLYSSSIFSKSKSAGFLTSMRLNGEDRIQWKSALTERTCEWCGAMHNKVLTLEKFQKEFPPHPYCECWGEATQEEFSQEVPDKDSSNWSNIKK